MIVPVESIDNDGSLIATKDGVALGTALSPPTSFSTAMSVDSIVSATTF